MATAPRSRRERHIPSRFLRSYKIQEVIKRRQILLVQVVKEERGTKGAALTTYLSLAGRFSVLMPNSPRGGGISRKITSASDRRRLKEIMAELEIPKGMGLIVRTAGPTTPEPEIRRDCEYLLRLWDDIREHTLKSVAPALIYEEASLIKRSIRDVYSRDIEEIQVDGEEGWRAAHEFMRMLMPSHAKKVQLWKNGGMPLFAKNQVEAQRFDAAADGAASVRRLSGDQSDRGAGGDRRQLGPLHARARHRGDGAAHQHGSRRRGGAAAAVAGPCRPDRHRLHRHGGEEAQRRGSAPPEGGAEERPRAHPGRSHQPFRPDGNEPAAAASVARRDQLHRLPALRRHGARALHRERRDPRAARHQRRKAPSGRAEIVVYAAPPVALYILNHKRERLGEIEQRYGMRVLCLGEDGQMTSQFRIERLRAQVVAEAPVTITQDVAQPAEVEAEEEAAAVEDEEDEAEAVAEPADAEDDAAGAVAGETAEEAERAPQASASPPWRAPRGDTAGAVSRGGGCAGSRRSRAG